MRHLFRKPCFGEDTKDVGEDFAKTKQKKITPRTYDNILRDVLAIWGARYHALPLGGTDNGGALAKNITEDVDLYRCQTCFDLGLRAYRALDGGGQSRLQTPWVYHTVFTAVYGTIEATLWRSRLFFSILAAQSNAAE